MEGHAGGIKMSLVSILRRLIYPSNYSSNVLIKNIKSRGGVVGEGTVFFAPTKTVIDLNRASYLKIGSYCKITSDVQIMCHDYSWSVLRRSHNRILPDSGRSVIIGNNCFIGWGAYISGPVTIGDNVIIGAHSVVTKDIPSNTVVAGNPAKIICSLDEYYEKKKSLEIENAYFRARQIYYTKGQMPTPKDMGWFCVLFLPRDEQSERFLRGLPFKGDNIEEVINTFNSTAPLFSDFTDFLNCAFDSLIK